MKFKYDKTYKLAAGQDNWFRRITMKLRLSNIDKEIRTWRDKRVLDIGCSGGMLQKLLSPRCREVYGLDINQALLKDTNIQGNYICGDTMNLPLANDRFDVVICSHLLEHLPFVCRSIEEINRVLKPRGKLFILYPIEIFRGATCIPDVLLSGQRLNLIREIHLHRLSLKKLKGFIDGTQLRINKHRLIFAIQPMFMATLTKV
jgi:ubiquinone/menaquinone biosynthesis C-methylase UbiE